MGGTVLLSSVPIQCGSSVEWGVVGQVVFKSARATCTLQLDYPQARSCYDLRTMHEMYTISVAS